MKHDRTQYGSRDCCRTPAGGPHAVWCERDVPAKPIIDLHDNCVPKEKLRGLVVLLEDWLSGIERTEQKEGLKHPSLQNIRSRLNGHIDALQSVLARLRQILPGDTCEGTKERAKEVEVTGSTLQSSIRPRTRPGEKEAPRPPKPPPPPLPPETEITGSLEVEGLGVTCLTCGDLVVWDFYCDTCMPLRIRAIWPHRHRIDISPTAAREAHENHPEMTGDDGACKYVWCIIHHPEATDPALSVVAAKIHHQDHYDMDGDTCLLNACALHYPSGVPCLQSRYCAKKDGHLGSHVFNDRKRRKEQKEERA